MNKSTKEVIAANIKNLRMSKKLTQVELAKELGISYGSIVDYENARREPNAKNLVALERFFGVSGEYLRGETEERTAPIYKWEDAELMDAVSQSFDHLFTTLLAAVRASSALEQKMVFDILIELRHVLTSERTEAEQKQAAALLLQESFVITTRFIDTCNNTAASDTARNVSTLADSALRYRAALEEALPNLSCPPGK
ncbi:MAG: helix-turn-helix domain-containing protein [Oscillospiraceae bacterium]